MSTRRDFLKLAGAGATLLGGAACAGSRSPAAARAASGATSAASPSLIRLGSNENPFGPGPAALRAIQGALGEANRYPFQAIGELTEAVAAGLHLDASQIAIGCGSSELLDAAVSSFTSAERGLLTVEPTFEAPADHAARRGAPVVSVPVDAKGRLDLEAMVDRGAACGLAYLCNPNNPTGTVHGADAVAAFVERLHRRAPDATT
jgi:histidinol-phosphate aminotransferase